MRAYELAQQNFAIAEHLLQLHQLFHDMSPCDPGREFSLAVCDKLALPENAALHHSRNNHLMCSVHSVVPVPSCLTAGGGLDFLLRQSVLVTCSALESFFWDVLRENALIVVKAKGRRADASLKNITLTIDDYLSLEDYEDADERLKEIILKRFERGTLYDDNKINEIAEILTVRSFWKDVSRSMGVEEADLRKRLTNLIQRRNQITHRADRPDEKTAPEDIDAHGLRTMPYGWAHTHVSTAKAFVSASSGIFTTAVSQLQDIIRQKEEQRLAQQTLAPRP